MSERKAEQPRIPPSPLAIVEEVEATFERATYDTAKAIEDRIAPDGEPADETEAADTNAAVFAAFQMTSDLVRIIDVELRGPMERAFRLAKRALR